MQMRSFGSLGEVSALTLGGGGIGQVWGSTTRSECVASVREAADAGITFLDVAPSYGNGEAESVIGEAFSGQLPPGLRVSTKCRVGNPAPEDVLPLLESSLAESLSRMKLESVDLFILHGMLAPDDSEDDGRGTRRSLFTDAVRPAFEQLMRKGKIGAWGITGIGEPEMILKAIGDGSAPAAVQAVANLLDSPGAMGRFDGPAHPREIIAAAKERGIGVMGIRAVQAGALTDGFDREIPEDHADMQDYRRSEKFRGLARETGESPASLAHRYSLSMDGVSTVVLGVKNRAELHECLEAEANGPLSQDMIGRIDEAVGGQFGVERQR